MYKITYVHKNETAENDLYVPGSREYCLTEAQLSVECGKSGELSVSIPDVNPAKAEIQCLTDEVIVYRNDKEIWRGRPVTMQIDFELTGNLTCEGILSYLYDTYFEPFEFEGSPKDLLQWLLDNHNSKVEERKQFKLGEVTVEDSNDYINRSSIYYDRTLSVMTDKLSGSSLGGMFRARVESDGRYIDYISAYEGESDQPVRYGYNLLDIAQDIEYGDLATVILPLGAKLQDEEGMDTDERLTVESVNGGSIYVTDDAAVERYGWIVVEMEWDDVTVASNLLEKAQYALAQQIMPISQFTIEAVDMSLADPELDPINLGDFVLIRVDAFGVNQMVQLTGMDIDILDPVSSTLQFGMDAATLSGTTNNTARSIQESMNSMTVRFDNLSTNVLNAVYANIEEIVAGTITVDFIQAAVADLGYVTADWVEANTINVDYLEANYASIYDLDVVFEYVVSLEGELANFGDLFANYATIEDLTAALATIGDLYVGKAEIDELLAGYATIIELNAVSADVGLLNADVADIVSLLAGEAGVGILESIHLTTANAVIDEAVIVEALVGTVLADIIQSNVIYTDYITIMSENGGIVIAGTTMQFSDSSGTVRLQLGEDAEGNFTFILYDETGTGIMIDSEGIHASAVPDGLIVNDMVADDANIAASKLDIADLTETLNANGDLVLSAEQITIGGGTLDYTLTEITQQIAELEALDGVQYVENYYALTTNPDWYPPQGETGDGSQTSILGEMVLGEAILGYGGESDWTTERLVAKEGEYLWYCQKITYTDGHVVWTTPTLITDDYIRTTVTVTQTELEVVQGQIQAKIWQSDIDTAVNSLGDEISSITDQYALLTITLNEIDERVGALTTTVTENYTELSSQVSSLTLDLDGITAEVRDVYEKTSNAITEGVPYYAQTTTPDWYPPHETSGNTSILGEMVLGEAILGFGGDEWTTEQPEYQDGMYTWICYLRTRVDGSTYWTEPTLLVDAWARDNFEYMSERYAQIVIQVDSILAEVVNVQSLLTNDYSTTSEMRAAIELAVEDSEAYVDIIVSDLEEQVTADLVTMSQTISDINVSLGEISLQVSDVESKTANAITEGVPYYAVSSNPDWYPPHESSGSDTSILGEMVLGQAILGYGGPEDWVTEQPTAKEGQYVWISYLRTRVDGSTYWTEPTLLTDEWERLSYTEMSNRYTQLVLDLNSALLEVYDLEQSLNSNYMTTTEAHAYIEEVANSEYASIMEEVSFTYVNYDTLDEELRGYYTINQTDAAIKEYADEVGGSILATVSGTYATSASLDELEEKTNNAIVEGVPYYATSDNADWYPPHESSGSDTSILGEMVLGQAILGYGGESDWTTEQPSAKDGRYIWISYLRTRVDGSTYWTEPTLLTDEWTRLNYITLAQATATIEQAVDAEHASILEEVSYTYATNSDLSSVTQTIASIQANVDANSSAIEEEVQYRSENYTTTADMVLYVGEQIGNFSVTVSNNYALKSEMSAVNEMIESLQSDSVASVETFYAVSNNPDSPEETNTLAEEDFTDGSLDSCTRINTSNSFQFVTDENLGPCYQIMRTGQSTPGVRFSSSFALVANKKYRYKLEAATTDIENPYDAIIQYGKYGDLNTSYAGNLMNDGWTTFIVDYEDGSSQSSARFEVDGSSDTSIPILIKKMGLYEVAEEAEWSVNYPTVITPNDFVWVRFLVTYNDGHTEYTEPVCLTTDTNDLATKGQMSATIDASIDDAMADILLQVSGTYATQSSLNDVSALVDSSVSDIEIYYAVSDNPDSISSSATWTTTIPSVDDDQYLWFRHKITHINGSTEWTTPSRTTPDLSSYTNTAGMESYVDAQISSITLSVENGRLGQKATITMTAGETAIWQELDMTQVRQAFADDNTQVTIRAGTVTFETGRLIINGGNLTLDSEGNATFAGELIAPYGNIGGWMIGDNSLFNGTDSMESKTAGTYIGTDGIRQYYNGEYLTINQTVLINGTDSGTRMCLTNGTLSYTYRGTEIGGFGGAAFNNTDYIGTSISLEYGADYFAINRKGSASASNYNDFAYLINYNVSSLTGVNDLHIFYGNLRVTGSINNVSVGYALTAEGDVYSTGEYYEASDEKIKKEISPLSVKTSDAEEFIEGLIPVEFKFENDKENKTHFGLTYQNVRETLTDSGFDPDQMGIVSSMTVMGGEKVGTIAYSELIPILVYEVQQLKKQVNALQQAS